MRLARELWILAVAFVVAGILVTGLAGFFGLLGVDEPERWGRKPLVPLFVIAWFLVSRTRGADLRKVAGMAPPARRPALLGLACGTAGLVAFDLLLIGLDARRIEPEVPALELGGRVALYLFQALVLALLEEGLFRGIVHGRLRAAAGPGIAVGLGSLVFAAAHFLRPPKDRPAEGFLDTMPACLAGVPEGFTDRWRELLGLFLVGAVLALLRERTGSIFLPLGVHAGWVWVQKVSRKALEEVDATVTTDIGFYGTMRVYDGVLGWSALLLTLALAWWVTRTRDTIARGRDGGET